MKVGYGVILSFLCASLLAGCAAKQCPADAVCIAKCNVYSQCNPNLLYPYGSSPCYKLCTKSPRNSCYNAVRRHGDYWGCKGSGG